MGDRSRALLVLTVAVAVIAIGGVGLASSAPLDNGPDGANGGAAGNGTTGIHGTAVSGSGYIDDQYELVANHSGSPYVWSTQPLTVNATLGSAPNGASGEYTVCANATAENGTEITDLGCQATTVQGGNEETVSFMADWPNDYTGSAWITIQAQHQGTGDRYYKTVPVTVVAPEGDLDGEGLANAEEIEHDTDFTEPDTDGDGVTDWEEVQLYGTDPLETDTTGDGVSDGTLVQFNLDPTQPYILHLYAGGAILLFVLVVTGSGALGWRLMQRYARSQDGGSGGTTTGESSQSQSMSDPSPKSPPTPDLTGTDDMDEPPLTKEEEICQLLREHAGRMRQSELVERTEWSNATVSRVLAQLERDGIVTKLKAGRENIVELHEEQPPDAQ